MMASCDSWSSKEIPGNREQSTKANVRLVTFKFGQRLFNRHSNMIVLPVVPKGNKERQVKLDRTFEADMHSSQLSHTTRNKNAYPNLPQECGIP